MSREYLDPKQPLNIEPAADRNVERITDCCLDAAPKMSFFLGKGRLGGAWWMIWLIFSTYVACIFSLVYVLYKVHFNISSTLFLNGLFEVIFYVIIPCTLVFGLSLLWPIHVWKTHYPIRFSRKTRKVYCHWYGKTYIEGWDTIKAYLQIKMDFNAQGAPSQTPQINIEFHNDDGSVAEHSVIGLTGFGIGLTIDEKAAATWEYIRCYMEEGPEHLPKPDLDIERPLTFNEIYHFHNPFPILKSDNELVWPFEMVLFFPFRFVWFLIAYPTEILYYFLDKHVEMKPFPQEMDEPCHCDHEVVIWEPKKYLERPTGWGQQPDGVRVNLL